MSEYEYEQPTHDEPTADYPPADQYDNLIGQPLDGGFDAPHEQSVGGFTANDGYGPDVVNYGSDEAPEHAEGGGYGAGYGETAGAPDYAGAEGETAQYDPAHEGGQTADDPNYAADGGEYAQPTQGTSTSGTSAQ